MRTRGQCPSLISPMATGDGLLARLPPLNVELTLDAVADLCGAAHRYGNGEIEVTARGNLQVRGLRPEVMEAFATSIAGLGLAPAPFVPISINPLSAVERDEVVDLGFVVQGVRTRLTGSRIEKALAPKVTVVIDGAGSLHLDALAADVRLRASPGPCLHVAVGGDGSATWYLGTIEPRHAIEAVLRLLELLAERGPRARSRELLRTEGEGAFLTALSGILTRRAAAPPLRARAEPVGVHALRNDRVALGVALPFGSIEHAVLAGLLAAAQRAGASSLRTAARTLLILGLAPQAVGGLKTVAERLGFIVALQDARRHVVACAGAPCCAAGEIAARELGPAIAQQSVGLFDGSVIIHVSGCPKGCAFMGRAAFTIVGRRGEGALVLDGGARDAPAATLPAERLPALLAKIAAEVQRARAPGELAADVLSRPATKRRVSRILAEAQQHG
jgi:precorrin-3B synthase